VTWTTLTGASAVVALEGKLLLVKQRRPYGVHWELPSGYYEPGESFEEAAAREVLEETGIDVHVGELVCTLVWEREHDRRRNVLAFFTATPVDAAQQPRPQLEEGIEDAAYLHPDVLPAEDRLHPIEVPVLDGLHSGAARPFHVHVDVDVQSDGTQSYRVRGDAS
jgi:8-oxo-dGTP diphosphatase